jgi:hypothetical protein
MDVHRRLLSTLPSYSKERARIENAILAKSRTLAPRAGIIVIPVVVHVVWNETEQNISDEQIQSQLVVLNQDFRKGNADIVTIPEPFLGLAEDAQIEFRLATRDPSGNPSVGITRTRTDKTIFTSDDEAVKFDSLGGVNAWPANRYLNIWVCPCDSLGYAQLPGGPKETDGVVVDYEAFGTTGTAAYPFHLGRTATHEVGHWLNLFHIWGEDGTGCSGTDLVDDTPLQDGPHYGTPTFPQVSCANGPYGGLYVNFMDYVDDSAMVMFTRMQHLCPVDVA